MSLSLVTPPAAVPVSRAEGRAQCRIDPAEESEDALLAGYIRSAADYVEGQSGLRLITSTWDYTLDGFPRPGPWGWLRLPQAPLHSIVSINYTDELGAEQLLAPAVYLARGIGDLQPARLILAPDQEWPTTWRGLDTVTVRFVAGFGPDWNSVPESLRQSISMLAAYWYSQREAASIGPDSGPVSDVPFSVKQILEPYKVWAV